MKRIVLVSAAVFALGGCANQAAPNYISGKYFMAGDSDCIRGSVDSFGNLRCYNENGEYTGSRREMSELQVKAWYAQRQAEASQPVVQPTVNKPIFCNQIGNTTICN
ncbi:hypothetical protein ACE02G_20070 [Shewanella xiamenensis]|uniref:hypothetical protein n=1 Tax=Shewanella xiamenensis TaxID=332186 RepID=UPI0035B7451B